MVQYAGVNFINKNNYSSETLYEASKSRFSLFQDYRQYL